MYTIVMLAALSAAEESSATGRRGYPTPQHRDFHTPGPNLDGGYHWPGYACWGGCGGYAGAAYGHKLTPLVAPIPPRVYTLDEEEKQIDYQNAMKSAIESRKRGVSEQALKEYAKARRSYADALEGYADALKHRPSDPAATQGKREVEKLLKDVQKLVPKSPPAKSGKDEGDEDDVVPKKKAPPPGDETALLGVLLPPNARLSVDGRPVVAAGSKTFTTPPLQAGRTY